MTVFVRLSVAMARSFRQGVNLFASMTPIGTMRFLWNGVQLEAWNEELRIPTLLFLNSAGFQHHYVSPLELIRATPTEIGIDLVSLDRILHESSNDHPMELFYQPAEQSLSFPRITVTVFSLTDNRAVRVPVPVVFDIPQSHILGYDVSGMIAFALEPQWIPSFATCLFYSWRREKKITVSITRNAVRLFSDDLNLDRTFHKAYPQQPEGEPNGLQLDISLRTTKFLSNAATLNNEGIAFLHTVMDPNMHANRPPLLCFQPDPNTQLAIVLPLDNPTVQPTVVWRNANV